MRTLHLLDKSSWGEGPWLTEPDYCNWIDAITSYPCFTLRSPLGAWCGSVGVDEHHPLFMTSHSAEAYSFIDVHGGVSATGFSEEDALNVHPPKRYWFVGFDCMHPRDVSPGFEEERKRQRKRLKKGAMYRDLPYVLSQVKQLAHQLANYDLRMADVMTQHYVQESEDGS